FPAILVRQPFAELFPTRAAVGRFVNRAFRSTAVKAEGRATPLVGSRVNRVWALRIHGDIADAGVVADFQNLGPGFATVGRFIHAAFRIRAPQMAERGN